MHSAEYKGAIDIHKVNISIFAEFLHIQPDDARILYTMGGTHSIV